jgi:hypothetical protein
MTSRLWFQRHGPVAPVVRGALTLLAASGILAMLIAGLVWGRPLTPGTFAFWVPLSVFGLILVAYEWSRWFFIGFASIVVVLLLVLVVELGENVHQQTDIANARSTEQVLAIQLGRSEHVAAATQLKALASSVTGPNAPAATKGSAGDVGSSIAALQRDLQRLLVGKIAAASRISYLNRDQKNLTAALLVARALPSATEQAGSPSTPQVTVDGSALSLRWWSYVSTATYSLQHLCQAIGPPPTPGPVPVICPAAGSAATTSSPTPAQLAQAVTPAISAVSDVVVDVHPTTANASQVEAADKGLMAAFSTPQLSSANIASNLSAGASELVAYFEQSLPGSSWWYTPLDFGAWIVLAVLILLGLRLLLLLNNRNGWGPIEVELDSTGPDAKPNDGDLERLGIIRSYILENIPEPAAALGSNALTQITTLVTATSLNAPWVQAVANFAEWALLPPSGYRILVDFRATTGDGSEGAAPHPGGPKAPSPFCVVVRIATRGRSKTLDVDTIDPAVLNALGGEGSDDESSNDDVLRAAGYWAAGWILSNCKLVPSWSVWSAQAGRPLGRFRAELKSNRVVLADSGSAAASKRRETAINGVIAPLETARAANPESGVVLTQLAEQYEFKNDFVNALEVNLQVVRLYPRYYVARYRVATGLSMLVSSGSAPWEAARKSPDRQDLRILSLLEDINAGGRSTTKTVESLRTSSPGSREAKEVISILAAAQLQRGRRLAKARWMAVMSLRKDERRFWLSKFRRPFLIRHNLGSALPSIGKAGGYDPKRVDKGLLSLDGAKFFEKPKIETVERWALSRKESAQVLYNLACYHAFISGAQPGSSDTIGLVKDARGDLLEAVRLLEQTQTQPYAEQIRASWMERDPDLEWLRNNGYTPQEVRRRFQQRLLALMRGGVSAQRARDGVPSV